MSGTVTLLDEEYVTAAFKQELSEMENRAVKEATIAILRRAHPRFYTGPATTTGKYHPDEFFAGPDGDPSGARPNEVNSPFGGQVLHVKRVAVLARHLADRRGWAGIERELVIAGALCHDTAKFADDQKHSVSLHEGLVASRISDVLADKLLGRYAEYITLICEGHSGRWGIVEPDDVSAERLQELAEERPGMLKYEALAAVSSGRLPLRYRLPDIAEQLSIADYLASRENIGSFKLGVVDWRPRGR